MPEPKEEGRENLDNLLSQKNNRTERKNSCKHLKLRDLRATIFSGGMIQRKFLKMWKSAEKGKILTPKTRIYG